MTQLNARKIPVTSALVALQRAVPTSRIVYETDQPNALPFCTVDGKRQVISMQGYPGYDLWVPRRKPAPGDAVTCSHFGVSLDTAAAFLQGLPMKVIREKSPPKRSVIFDMAVKFTNHIQPKTGSLAKTGPECPSD